MLPVSNKGFCTSSHISSEGTGTRLSLIQGTTCSDLCNQAQLDKFRECAGDYHSFKISLVRGWNLMFLNKTEFSFSCRMHATSNVCLINSDDFVSLQAQLTNKKVNSLKARKSRARRLKQPIRELPKNLAGILDAVNMGHVCGHCMMDLSLDPAGIVCNVEYSLNFCEKGRLKLTRSSIITRTGT